MKQYYLELQCMSLLFNYFAAATFECAKPRHLGFLKASHEPRIVIAATCRKLIF